MNKKVTYNLQELLSQYFFVNSVMDIKKKQKTFYQSEIFFNVPVRDIFQSAYQEIFLCYLKEHTRRMQSSCDFFLYLLNINIFCSWQFVDICTCDWMYALCVSFSPLKQLKTIYELSGLLNCKHFFMRNNETQCNRNIPKTKNPKSMPKKTFFKNLG